METTLLCLHGWGGSGASFNELKAALAGSTIRILTPDLPGFGGEPEPRAPWTVEEYADWVERWIRAQAIVSPLFLLGHSHGGRLAIVLTARKRVPLEHLFLVAAAGIPHARPLRNTVGWILAKTGALLLAVPGLRRLHEPGKRLLYKLLRVHDYETASPVMRETMRKVKSADLRPLLRDIAVPTDIFWGDRDTMTPIGDAQVMQSGIAGSTLTVFPGMRHRIHRDRAAEIAQVIRSRLRT